MFRTFTDTGYSSAELVRKAPLIAVQVLCVNLIREMLGALPSAMKPPNDEKPEVGRDENFITRTMWRNIIVQSLYQLVAMAIHV